MGKRDAIDPNALQRAARTKPAVLAVIGVREFEREVIESDTPVVADFWAPWCAPCVKLGEALEALAPLYAGRLRFVKVNLMENQWAKERFGITNIPLVLGFSGSKTVPLLGAVPRKELVRFLDELAG